MADIASLLPAAGAQVASKASGLGNLLAGIFGMRQAKKLKKTSLDEWKKQMGFEDYETPESYEKYRDLLGLMSRQEMPGYSQQKQEIEASTAATLSQARNLDTSSAAAVLLGAGQDRLRALRQLGLAASQYQQGARQQYAQSIGQGAQYEDLAYQYNQWLPQQMKANLQMGIANTSRQMLTTGFDEMLGAEGQGANLASQQMWFDRMYPQQQPQAIQPQSQPQPQLPDFYNGMNPNFNFNYQPPQGGWNSGWIYNPMTGKYEMKTWGTD